MTSALTSSVRAQFVKRFSFWPLATDPQHSIHPLEKVLHQVDTLNASFELVCASELIKLPVRVYHELCFVALVFAAAIIGWLWIGDDVFDEPKLYSLAERIQTALDCKATLASLLPKDDTTINSVDLETIPIKPHSDITKLLTHLLQSNDIPSPIRKCLAKEIDNFLDGVLIHIQSTQVMSVAEFTATRVKDSACDVVWSLYLLDESPEVMKEGLTFLESDIGVLAKYYANLNISYSNDLFSFARDVRQGLNFNVILSIMKDECIGELEAAGRCVDMANQAYEQLLALKTSSAIGSKLLQQIAQWCRGSLAWHDEAQRNKECAASPPVSPSSSSLKESSPSNG